jgi:hypothetical protein
MRWRRWVLGSDEELRALGLPDRSKVMARQTSERYQKSQPHYAKLYGRDVKNIKRWVAAGRRCEPMDLPPFDEPARMADWFRRVMGQEPRENLTRFEAAAADEQAGGSAGAAAPEAKPAGPAAELPPLPPMQIDLDSTGGADLGLQQVRALVIATFEQMRVALTKGRTQEAAQLRREWQQAVQILRAWEKDIIKIQEGRGEVLRTSAVKSEMVQMMTTTAHSFYNGLQKVIRQLAPAMPANEQRALAVSMRDACFTHLKKTRWATDWKPEDVEPAPALGA